MLQLILATLVVCAEPGARAVSFDEAKADPAKRMDYLKALLDPKVFDKAKIRSIYKSQTFPTTGYGYAHNLDPKLVEKIKEAFFNFPWEGSALAAEFKKEGKFIPIDYKKDWEVMRNIDEATGVKYTCK